MADSVKSVANALQDAAAKVGTLSGAMELASVCERLEASAADTKAQLAEQTKHLAEIAASLRALVPAIEQVAKTSADRAEAKRKRDEKLYKLKKVAFLNEFALHLANNPGGRSQQLGGRITFELIQIAASHGYKHNYSAMQLTHDKRVDLVRLGREDHAQAISFLMEKL
jgi:hypothetical protein